MDPKTKENWAKVKAALETANKTDTYFYKRAVVICDDSSILDVCNRRRRGKDPLLESP